LNKNAFTVLVMVAVGGLFTIPATSAAVAGKARTAADLYVRNCASCHGRDGRAKTLKARVNHARKLSDPEWQDRVSDERIFNVHYEWQGENAAVWEEVIRTGNRFARCLHSSLEEMRRRTGIPDCAGQQVLMRTSRRDFPFIIFFFIQLTWGNSIQAGMPVLHK
jgi:hypothetical protein